MSYTNTISLPECYKMLNLSPGVNWAEVKKTYHALALKFHPDHNPNIEEYENKFKDISRAYKTLESHYQSTNRQKYIYNLSTEDNNFHYAGASDFEPSPPNKRSIVSDLLRKPMDKELVTDLKNRLGNYLQQFEKKVFQLDIEKDIKITSSIVAKGGVVKVCQNKEKFEVPIPQGSWSRMKIRIPNKGESSWFSKKRGDLFLDVQVHSVNYEKCVGQRELHYDFPVSLSAIKVRKMHTLMTAQGEIKFFLPSNVRNGQTFILKTKPDTKDSLQTNHIIKIQLSS